MKTCYIDFPTRSIADLSDFSAVGLDGLCITRINVPPKHRGKGLGSKLLNQIIRDADAENITLHLEPLATGGLPQKQLEAWYKKHGFKWNWQGDFFVMTRQPKRDTKQ